MARVEEAQAILRALGMPAAQCNAMSGMTLIALCGLKPDSHWSEAERSGYTLTKGIMYHLREHFPRPNPYAPNTRETIRRQVLHQFIQGGIADYNPFNPSLPTNSPRTHYAVTKAALKVVRLFGTDRWDNAVSRFRRETGALVDRYQAQRDAHMVKTVLPSGVELLLSPGRHNEVQKAIVEEFMPRFASGGVLLYLGDTAKKDLYVDRDRLSLLGISITEHDKLPDVVLYDESRGWLFLIEAVTSHGPMTPKRVVELEELLATSSADAVYVTAFPDLRELRRHIQSLAWETEVWLVDTPDHMIHFDGEKFLGPGT